MNVRARIIAGWVLLGLMAALPAPLADDRPWDLVDWDRVKREWKRLSPTERALA